MTTVSTRFGRNIKRPVLYVPTEEVLIDDFGSDEYDSMSDSDVDTVNDSTTEDEDTDEDADDNGNLKDFIVDDESESE